MTTSPDPAVVLHTPRPRPRPGPLAATAAVALAAIPAGGAAALTINASSDAAYQSLASATVFDAVGQFTGDATGGDFSASGVYLGDGWVVTAAHVVDSATDLSFSVGGTDYDAAAWTYHSSWDPGDVSAGGDIALVKLTEDVSDVTAAALYSGTDETGSLGITVGYGLTGTGATGYDVSSDTDKRAGTNIVDAVLGGDVLVSDFDSGRRSDSVTGSSRATVLESLIAPGDSGGGLFLYDASISSWALAGINSFGFGLDGEADSDWGDLSGQTRVSSYADWIDLIMGADLTQSAALLSGQYDSAVFTLVPEPSAVFLMAGGGWLLTRRRPAGRGSRLL